MVSVTLVGVAVSDPESILLGSTVCFNLVAEGAMTRLLCWVTVEGNLAEYCKKNVAVGRAVFVTGDLHASVWGEGPGYAVLEIFANQVKIIPSNEALFAELAPELSEKLSGE
jgi:single-stranded DNA-binding protein